MPDDQDTIIKTIKKASPAVVSIIVTKDLPRIQRIPIQPFGEEENPLEDFFGPWGFGFPPMRRVPRRPQNPKIHPRPERIRVGGGSGFIIAKNGVVLTNRHVVSSTKADYTVVTLDDKEYKAKVLARDPINDIAVIEVKAKNLPTLELGDSAKLELGQTAIAIGNALGEFRNTVSTGVVSGLSRSINARSALSGQTQQLRGLIQTDAAINPGNSGGPLIDINGRAIGINTAIVLGAQNIGFTIPINAAKKAIDDLKRYGRIVHPFLGIRYVVLNKEIKEKNNLPVDYGALVVREQAPGDVAVVPGGPASRAGVKENDIILEFNGEKITEQNTLQDFIQNYKVGEEIKLKILRQGEEMTLKAILEERKC